MKIFNLKKHIAIALAILSASSSLSVFANGGEEERNKSLATKKRDLSARTYSRWRIHI